MSQVRYNLGLSDKTYESLQKIATKEGTTVAELLRRATRLFLFVRSITDDPRARLLIERDDEIQELVVELI